MLQSDKPGKEAITIQAPNVQLMDIETIVAGDNKPGSINISPRSSQTSNALPALISASRDEIGNHIAHYTFEIKLGDLAFNTIRLHRVVRESQPYRPVPVKANVFMMHGASQDFSIFYNSGAAAVTPKTSSVMYLANHGVDVWCIDQAWTLVPATTTDFEFMKDWGIERDTDNSMAGLAIARMIRGMTGNGFGQMNLLGFSYGAMVAYSAAGRETQEPAIWRDIKGLIQVDQVFKYAPADEAFRLNACDAAAATLGQLNAGIYQNGSALFIKQIGEQAKLDPDGASPVIPGFTNRQVALFFGGNTFNAIIPPATYWHFTGGNQSEPTGIATDFMFTSVQRWINGLSTTQAAYQPNRTGYDLQACWCNETDVSFDDHLSEITLPIFYLGAGGGFGRDGLYTTTLTQSQQVSEHIVSKTSDRYNDFGHADLFMGEDASYLAWSKLHQWIKSH